MVKSYTLLFLLLTIVVVAQSRHLRHQRLGLRKLGAPGFHPRFSQGMYGTLKSMPTGSILLLSMLNNLGSPSVEASTTTEAASTTTTEENLLRLY